MERELSVRGTKGFWGHGATFVEGEETRMDFTVFQFLIFTVTLLSCLACAGTVSLSADIATPAPFLEPQAEVTVWINTNAPILCMNLLIRVTGDATITDAMDETDAGNYGWDANYSPTSTINPDNSIRIYGVQWSTNQHTTVGYFKFRYNSGVVSLNITDEEFQVFNWNESLTFDPNPLVVGSIPVIEIDSDITVNQFWTADKVYYVAADPNIQAVNVQALLVIEPGTLVIMGQDSGLFVNNGGTVIAKGTPDKPIIFTPDYYYLEYPDYVGYYWQFIFNDGVYYYSPLYIESTASPATTVQNCMIEGAYIGIVTYNIRLVNPIENNYVQGNRYGILGIGPKTTDIINNLSFCNDYAGIEVYLVSGPNDIPDTSFTLKIEQNTCDYNQYDGILIHGVADPNNIPPVDLTNNIVSWNEIGLNFVDGYIGFSVANTGYCLNWYDKNWEFDESTPVIIETDPFIPEPSWEFFENGPLAHHYLETDSGFVDTGYQWIEQTPFIGFSTSLTGSPDKGQCDLGFHRWRDKTGSEDILGADIDDLVTLSNYWLAYSPFDPNGPGYISPDDPIYDPNSPLYDPNSVSYGGDWDENGYVDQQDFSILAGIWLVSFELPDLAPVITGDPNQGWVELSVTGYSADTQTVYAYLNGQYLGRVYMWGTTMPQWVDLSESGPVSRVKFMAVDDDDHYYYSDSTEIAYTSPLSYCVVPQTYEPNEPIPFSAVNTGMGNTTVSVHGNGNQLLWSQSFSGNTISGTIPRNITSEQLLIEAVRFSTATNPTVDKLTYPLVTGKVNPDIKALIISPDPVLTNVDGCRNTVMNAFAARGINAKVLVGKMATWNNVAKYGLFGNIKYVYLMAHGFYSFPGAPPEFHRTSTMLSDGLVLSCKYSDFDTAPGWCLPLPSHIERVTNSWAIMGFKNLEFFYNNGCYGATLKIDSAGRIVIGDPGQRGFLLDGEYQSDMSYALNLHDTLKARFYHGWFDKSYFGTYSPYTLWTGSLWYCLGEGSDLGDALSCPLQLILDRDALDNFRLKGQGTPTNIHLNNSIN